SSRQALEQARVAAEELEDLKATAKGLEEENGALRRQARHMVRERQEWLRRRAMVGGEASALPQNQRLLAEGQGLREQIQAQAARMADLEVSAGGGRAALSVLGLCQ
ncbi:KASH5 protein, partial [Sakesphorus luctuosus]|nr:KASH5 protein [Sakesphorus luctuosus]